jgi:hypothetical protein
MLPSCFSQPGGSCSSLLSGSLSQAVAVAQLLSDADGEPVSTLLLSVPCLSTADLRCSASIDVP